MSTAKMADINTSARKRKLSPKESLIEVATEEGRLKNTSGTAVVDDVEPDSNILHFGPDRVAFQSADSNLKSSSTDAKPIGEPLNEESVVNIKQKLLELDDEIRQLREDNAKLKSNLCSCGKTRSDKKDKVVTISILFSDRENFHFYKDRFIQLFELSPECCLTVEESNRLINVVRDSDIDPNGWVVIDEVEAKTLPGKPNRKRKKKPKSSAATTNDLFTLDTTPSISTKNNLCYESKFTVLNSTDNAADGDKQNELKITIIPACFNCDDSHNLRDCPKPKNYIKINAARQKFKAQQTKSTGRYHLEDDQRFAHLLPGKISDKLQRALRLRHDQLPDHIYRMRQMGYPPGWFEEIRGVYQSELVLFDFEGKCAFGQRKKLTELDPDKVVEYPGFNVPMEKGVKDEHRLYGCPPYSKELSKQNMLDFVQAMQKKAEDNLETCDMDIDNPPSDKEADSVKPSKHSKDQRAAGVDDSRNRTSPTLGELETAKQKLLAELTQDTSNNSRSEETNDSFDASAEAGYHTVDITGTLEEPNDTFNCEALSPITNAVKTSSFGTPILKSSSPYCTLPNPKNFSQNVSEVINFENLPNSTGKYEQMIGVLEKVRKTIRSLNDQQS